MQICPNGKFIKIFVQRFHYFEDPIYNFFAVNFLFQDASCSLALRYSSFLFKFFSFAYIILISGWKSVKFAPKFRIFLKFLTLEGTLLPSISRF